MRPIRRMRDQAVLYRVEMNVTGMRGEIPVVADCVLPIPALPDTAFAARGPCCRPIFLGRQSLRERNLDRAPAAGKIVVAVRQSPYPMHMVGKHDPGLDAKR